MLFVVARTGAEPTLFGGGELALEIEVEVIETLSDIASLVGVPGRSSRLTDARLGCLEGGKCGGNMPVVDDGVTGPPIGVSALGVGTTRKVLEAGLGAGDWAIGVLTGNGGNADAGIIGFDGVSGTAGVFATLFPGTAMFKPAFALFSLALLVVGGIAVEGVPEDFFTAADADFANETVLADGVDGVSALIFALSRAGKSSS